MKRVLQAYKAPDQWIASPPGVGDFVRGACHLFERLQGTGAELRLDVSQSGFAALIEQDSSMFQAGDAGRIAGAAEYFEDADHARLQRRLSAWRCRAPHPVEIEHHVLPRAQFPVVVTSDCHPLKIDLAQSYGMATQHRSQHGAYGTVLPVAMDLCMLKHSRFNYHINVWSDWWSGCSHHTSMIFKIPSMNFRDPRYAREEVTAHGQLLTDRRWWQLF